MSELTPSEITALRWMVLVNGRGLGLYGPTVKRLGPLEECERLVETGLAELRLTDGRMHDPARGYFITDAGLAALKARATPSPAPESA